MAWLRQHRCLRGALPVGRVQRGLEGEGSGRQNVDGAQTGSGQAVVFQGARAVGSERGNLSRAVTLLKDGARAPRNLTRRSPSPRPTALWTLFTGPVGSSKVPKHAAEDPADRGQQGLQRRARRVQQRGRGIFHAGSVRRLHRHCDRSWPGQGVQGNSAARSSTAATPG